MLYIRKNKNNCSWDLFFVFSLWSDDQFSQMVVKTISVSVNTSINAVIHPFVRLSVRLFKAFISQHYVYGICLQCYNWFQQWQLINEFRSVIKGCCSGCCLYFLTYLVFNVKQNELSSVVIHTHKKMNW